MQSNDLEGMEEMLSVAADLLLPLAKSTDWPCRLELVAWLIAIRDTFKPIDGNFH